VSTFDQSPWIAPAAALALAACGGPGGRDAADAAPPPYQHWCDPERTHTCPDWMICNAAPSPPAPPCVVVGDDAEDAAGCHAVACQALYDSCTTGDGGPGQCSCAAACQAQCSGNLPDELQNLDEALDAGVQCSW
jgi:hypothetical protein